MTSAFLVPAPPLRTHRRAAVLLVALALVGGTGCITSGIIRNVQYENAVRAREQARQRSVAELAPRAEAGDAAAMRGLAQALMLAADPAANDLPRALDWLERAAGQGDGAAQAMLGVALGSGRMPLGPFAALPQGRHDRARGIVLLQRAAAQACRFESEPNGFGFRSTIDPAARAAGFLHDAGQPGQALVWRAREILHCQHVSPSALAWQAQSAGATAAERTTAFAWLLLTGSIPDIAATRDKAAPDIVAAGERQAAELRRQVAESERDYPAPTRKDMP